MSTNIKSRRISQWEIIAEFYGLDYADRKDYTYQPTMWRNPQIYTVQSVSWSAAPSNGKMPKNYADCEWKKVGEWRGRPVFESIVEK
jgi:hypothetical protein